RNLAGRELRLERFEFPGEVGLEGDRVFFHDAFQEVEEIFAALRDLIDNSRAPVRRKDGRPVDEPPLEQLRELLVDGGSPDLEFFRQVFRMIEPLREQTQDLASRLRGRDAKPKNVRTQTVIRIPRKDFDRFDQRETYFAVWAPFRWTI